MIGALFKLFQPATLKPQIQDMDEINESYRYWRIRICYSIFIGYAVFYFTRKSFNVAVPFMTAELGFTKAELGIISSTLCITYAISKFVSGIYCDRSNPRYFMAVGLIITGFINICFGMCSSIWAFVLFWGLNGWFQAWGWPASCKLLVHWFEKKERGIWYSVCSTSHNVGGALIPLIAAWAASQYGWRWAMFIPAAISIVMGLFLMNRLRDVPQSLALPAVEKYNQMKSGVLTQEESKDINSENILSVKEILFKQVLTNRFIWMLSLSYFFVYIVRTSINDWSALYLIETKGIDKILANSAITWFELGGIAGMLLAGWGSDTFFRGNRMPPMILCSIGILLCSIGLWQSPHSHFYLDLTYIALLGCFVFGPQMIVGLAAAEYVDKRAASAANGFVGTLGYIGAATAGYPVGKLIDIYGWGGFLLSQVVSASLIILVLLPICIQRNDVQKLVIKTSAS